VKIFFQFSAVQPGRQDNSSLYRRLNEMYENLWEQTLPLLAQLRKTFSTPFRWDTKTKKFVLIQDSKYMRTFRAISFLAIAYTVMVTCSLAQTFRRDTSLLLQTISIWIFGFVSAVTIFRWIYTKGANETVHFLNLMVEFQISRRNRGKMGNNIGKYFYLQIVSLELV
jgi:hypothetical protein